MYGSQSGRCTLKEYPEIFIEYQSSLAVVNVLVPPFQGIIYPCGDDPPPVRTSIRLEGPCVSLILSGAAAAVVATDPLTALTPSASSVGPPSAEVANAAAALAIRIRFNFRFSVMTPGNMIHSIKLTTQRENLHLHLSVCKALAD